MPTASTMILAAALLQAAMAMPLPAAADGPALTRKDAATVTLTRPDDAPVTVFVSDDTKLDTSDRKAATASRARTLAVALPADKRRYVILQDAHGATTVLAERVLPLAQASNFRDVGGYRTRDGRQVKWGKAFRSGAQPMLTDADYKLIDQLAIGSVVDFRSIDEREVVPDQIDDRTGALYISNDYSMKPLFAKMGKGNGENSYAGMETLLAPQYRAMFRRLVADEGAVLYHCSAGQDRTGIATALLYDTLGVDRATILRDYHLSTALRRPQYEMPAINAADYPDNPIVQYYAAARAKGKTGAEPLYTPSGASHLAQFFTYIDKEYGGSEGYLKRVLGLTDTDIAKLRETMLD